MSNSSTNAPPPLTSLTAEERLAHLEEMYLQQAIKHKKELDALKAQLSLGDPHITTAARSTTLKVYDELAMVFPPIMPHNFDFSQ
ncbi:hypothetical protein BG006_001747, partial [Podila minutissima]